jgi:hypothetical protein
MSVIEFIVFGRAGPAGPAYSVTSFVRLFSTGYGGSVFARPARPFELNSSQRLALSFWKPLRDLRDLRDPARPGPLATGGHQ